MPPYVLPLLVSTAKHVTARLPQPVMLVGISNREEGELIHLLHPLTTARAQKEVREDIATYRKKVRRLARRSAEEGF
jgi:hypothetical protein